MRVSTILRVGQKNAEIQLRKLLGRPARPYKVLLELTYDCNSRCKTCDIWKTPFKLKKQHIQLPEIEATLKELGSDLVWLALSGGEITLYENFDQVVALCKKHNPKLSLVTFTTNGIIPEKALEYARTLKEAGYDLFVTVSLDGDKDTHDRIRGIPGNYESAQRTFELLKRARIPTHYGITIGDDNREFIEKQYSSYRDSMKAITFVSSGGIYAKSNSVDRGKRLDSLKTVLKAYRVRSPGEWIEKLFLRLAYRFFAQDEKRLPIPCEVIHSSLHIRPNGDIHPCMFLPPLGNIKRNSLRETLASTSTTEALEKIRQEKCPKCWLNCYAPHSILLHPLKSITAALIGPPQT